MSNQQSMFAEPEHRPPSQRSANTDPREQPWQEGAPQAEYPVYPEGYAGPGQMGGEKLQPQRPRRKGPLPKILIIGLICIALLGGFSALAGVQAWNQKAPFSSALLKPLAVSGAPKLIIHANDANIHVHTGENNEVRISPSNSVAKRLNVEQPKGSDTIVISVNDNGFFFGDNNPTLDITTPLASNLEIESSSGDIELSENLSGSAQIQTGSGDVDLHDFKGQATVNTGSGHVQGENISGALTVRTGSGDVQLRDSDLTGDSTFTTASGDFSYSGTLAPDHNYRVETSSGDVTFELPENAAIQSDIRTSSGDTDNRFPKASDTSPHANVAVTTASGDIAIRPR